MVNDNYDISKMKKGAYPLQSKIDKGELKLIDPLDIPEEALNEKLQLLSKEEREFIIQLKQSRHKSA